ncbi:MAG: ATP-binding cassette domain-containing protein [Candidatus Planktophila sp.]|nr:ATP-binding cassette domain-containing protein [Candidatus Planktophila sp.]
MHSQTAQVVISVRDACKEYGHVKALQGASLQLRRGEILALMGDNGAGKSTLLKSLSGVVTLDSGDIEILGKPVVLDSPDVAQNYGIETTLCNTDDALSIDSLLRNCAGSLHLRTY